MDREIDPKNRLEPEQLRIEISTQGRAQEPKERLSRQRQPYEIRGYRYQVSQAEFQTMHEIGRFRTINVKDLAHYLYKGKTAELREDLGSLRAQGLIQCRTVWTGRKTKKLTLAVLTKVGQCVLENQSQGSSQQVYAGLVKPAELAHDAAIYRMYQAEAEKIERVGGRIQRVILDYELKQKIYTPLAKARPKLAPSEYARRQAEVAAQNGLKVVGGRILLPDLRIEYESRDGANGQVDLEFATHHYRGSHMRGKVEAGFKMYARGTPCGL